MIVVTIVRQTQIDDYTITRSVVYGPFATIKIADMFATAYPRTDSVIYIGVNPILSPNAKVN